MRQIFPSWSCYAFLFICLCSKIHAKAEDTCAETVFAASTMPGGVATPSVLIKNPADKEMEFIGRMELPAGWDLLFPDESCFTLKPQEESLQLVAFRISRTCYSGQYSVNYLLIDKETGAPALIVPITLFVEPVCKIEAKLEELPKYLLAGETYEIKFRLHNSGNVLQKVLIEAKPLYEEKICLEPSNVAFLKPGETYCGTIQVTANALERCFDSSSVQIKFFNADNFCEYESLVASVKIFPKNHKQFDPYYYIPAEISLLAGATNIGTEPDDFIRGANNKSKAGVFTELRASGFIDAHHHEHLDLFVRQSLIRDITPIVQYLGEVPARFYINYRSPRLKAAIGDGFYFLSPLTIPCLYGRGAMLNLRNADFCWGVLYLKNGPFACNRFSDMAAFLCYEPSSFLGITASVLQTDLSPSCNYPLIEKEKNITTSLRAELNPSPCNYVELEYAVTSNPLEGKTKKQGFYLEGCGELNREVSYQFQGIYAGPQFAGYYNNQTRYSASIGFPILPRLRGFTSYNTLTVARTNSLLELTPWRSHYLTTGINYSFQNGYFGLLSYDESSSKDLSTCLGDHVRYLHFGIGKVYCRWTLQANLDFGSEGLFGFSKRGAWQNYQLYASFSPTDCEQYTVYSRLSRQFCNNEMQNTSAWGISGCWQKKRFSCNANYEYVNFFFTGFQHAAKAHLCYTLPNHHRFSFRGQCCYTKGRSTDYAVLFSYSIPIALPIGKNNSVGGAFGKITGQSGSGNVPLANMMIKCNQEQTLTNAKGEFCFTDLKPGCYQLWLEDDTFADLVPMQVNPLSLEVVGGRLSHVEVSMLTAAEILGEVALYELLPSVKAHGAAFESVLAKEGMETDESSYQYRKIGIWKEALVTLQSEDGQHFFQDMTNNKGQFCFKKLQPGVWTLTIESHTLPSNHYIEATKMTFIVSPGENKKMEFRILPRLRKIQWMNG